METPNERASGSAAVAEAMSETDAALCRRAQRGDAAAFEALVRRHLRAAHAAALPLVGSADEADDVCQDAFIAALQRIRQCREPQKFRAWLLAIVRNRALTARSRDAARGRVAEASAAEAAAPTETPLRSAARAELRGRLQSALETLTELQRSVLVKYDLEGWTHAEIAEELGISAVSSRFHLHVARRAMRARLAGLYGKESIA